MLVYRGTDDALDLDDDAQIGGGKLSSQYHKVKQALGQACEYVPDLEKKLYPTGHSLGGGLAVLLAFSTKRPLPVVNL